MKTIGFIKEIDVVPKDFLDSDKRTNCLLIDELEKERILDYLNNSERIYGVTWALYDGENYIGPYMLFSDGEWIWTGHFAYFLKKLNFSLITSEFLDHLRERQYQISPLSKEQREYIQIFLYLKLLQTSEKDKEFIRKNAIKCGYDISKI